jgi:hypothetical protein
MVLRSLIHEVDLALLVSCFPPRGCYSVATMMALLVSLASAMYARRYTKVQSDRRTSAVHCSCTVLVDLLIDYEPNIDNLVVEQTSNKKIVRKIPRCMVLLAE